MIKKFSVFSFLLFLLAGLIDPAVAEDKPSTIEITGRAAVTALPTTVTISFSVESDSPKAQAAVRDNAERTERVLAALKKVSDKDTKLRTTGFALSPVYEKTERVIGYRVRNTVVLESKDLDKTGSFIDDAAEAGVSRIGNLSFSNDKEEDLRKEAGLEALKRAMRDAEALAKAAGMTIKRILKITYDSREYPTIVMREAAPAAARTPIAVGEIPVQVEVHVTFEVN
ncbi:MAG: SIMPL domain-containing protein [Desulfobacterota bacterium]|jgi:hypothetical protein|nr:SIMPL domain-containing protein [Thermodesulfobacteriota bacterium]